MGNKVRKTGPTPTTKGFITAVVLAATEPNLLNCIPMKVATASAMLPKNAVQEVGVYSGSRRVQFIRFTSGPVCGIFEPLPLQRYFSPSM